MAAQTKERIVPETDLSPRANGEQSTAPAKRRSAADQLRPLFGKYKDNPRAREVLDGVVASRHQDGCDDAGDN
jgi:hypothetical protein